MLKFKTFDMIQEMAAMNVSKLNAEFLARAQKVTSFNLKGDDFITLDYKAEIQHLFHMHFFPKFDLEKTIKGTPTKNELNKLIKKLKQENPSKFKALHTYNLKGVGPGEATLFFLIDKAHLGGGSSAGVDLVVGSNKYEVKAGNFNAKQNAYKDFKLGGTVPMDRMVKAAFELRAIVDPKLRMGNEKNGVNGKQIEAIMKDKGLASKWNKDVETPYRKAASRYLNKNPLILMINTTPKNQVGEIYHIGNVKDSQIFVDVVTQGTIKPKIIAS
jgi:hypothetical protein